MTERIKFNPNDYFGELSLVVTWPESQIISPYEGFQHCSALINSEAGLDRFGPSAYRVNPKWWNDVKKGKIRVLTEEEIEEILESEDWETDYSFLDEDDDEMM